MRHSRSTTTLVATLALVGVSAGGPIATTTAGAKPGRPCDPVWRYVDAPPLPAGRTGILPSGVDVLSPDDVRFGSSTFASLTPDTPWIMEWNGRSLRPSAHQPPLTDPTWSDLGGMDFDSADHGWIVGRDLLEGNAALPYSSRWHGDRWTRITFAPAPDPETQRVEVHDVASVTPTDGWAVGALVGGEPAAAFLQHWDGRQWTNVEHPAASLSASTLSAVTAVAPDDVWAAGARHDENGREVPVIEHWDGSQWTSADLPELTGEGAIRALSASAGDDVWATGRTDHFGELPPLVMHFDGTRWTTVTGLPEGGGDAVGVYASSPTDVWVARNTPGSRADVLHWDGRSWSVMEIPGAQDQGRGVRAADIEGSGPDNVWLLARAFAGARDPQAPLVARYSCGGRR